MANLIVGPPATGERFYDRKELVKLIWERLESSNILFVAPRRFGKTSVMLNLLEYPKPDYKPIFMDVEWFESPSQFITEVVAEMIKCLPGYHQALSGLASLPRRLINLLRGINFEIGIPNPNTNIDIFNIKLGLKEKVEEDWQEIGKSLFGLVEHVDGKVLLILDELPLMLKRMLKGKEKDSVEVFLHWLRSFRIGQESIRNMRTIIGGSIGIVHVLAQADAIASMNDLESIKVDPFPPDIAKGLVVELFKSQGFSVEDDVVNQVLIEIEVLVPYFLQLLILETCNLAKDRKEKVSKSLVSEAYRDRVISVESRTYFESFYSRLKDYYEPEEERAAKAILLQLALKGKLTINRLHDIATQTVNSLSDEVFSHLLNNLENDFYLKREDHSYVFHTKVLRDWWVRFYSFK